MISVFSSVGALLLGYAFMMIGHGLTGTLLGVRASLEGFPTGMIGLIMSGFYFGYAVATVSADRIIARVGHIRAFAVFAAVVAISVLLAPILLDGLVWVVLRAAGGFGTAGIAMVTESWLNERATNQNRGRVLSVYMYVVNLSMGGGQFLLTVADPGGYVLFSIAAVLFCAALVPVSLTVTPTPTPVAASRFGLRQLWQASPLAVVGCFAGGLINGAFAGMAPVFGQEIGLATGEIALLMSLALFGGLFLQWPLGRLSDRWDRRWTIVVTCVGVALASVGLIFAGDSEIAIALLALLFGGFTYTLYSLGAAHANDFIAPADLVKAVGGLLLSFAIGAVIGPFAASLVMGAMGPSGLFVYTAAAAAGCTAFALHRMRVRPTVPAAEREAFVPLPQTSPVVHQLDPRGEGD